MRQAGDGVRGGVPGGQEDHRDLVAGRAQPAAYLEAVHVRQHHVEHDQVGLVGVGLPQRFRPGGRGGHRAAVELQRDLDKLADVRLVVHDEHLGNLVVVCHGYRASFSRAGRPRADTEPASRPGRDAAPSGPKAADDATRRPAADAGGRSGRRRAGRRAARNSAGSRSAWRRRRRRPRARRRRPARRRTARCAVTRLPFWRITVSLCQDPGPGGAVGRLDLDVAAADRLDHAALVGQGARAGLGLERELAVDPAQQREPPQRMAAPAQDGLGQRRGTRPP